MFPRTLVIVLFLAAQTALLWWISSRDRTSEARFTWTMVPLPAPVATPSPTEPPTPPIAILPPATARPSCPPPRTDASTGKLDLPRGVNHVTTSLTNTGWIAAWDEHQLFVSTDAGHSFARVLDGPGEISDVTFDCFGHPIVVRQPSESAALAPTLLGVRDGAHEMWRSVPGLRMTQDASLILVGGGPDVVAIGADASDESKTLVAISADLGATWWYRDARVYWDSTRGNGHEDPDGTIHVVLTTSDCMSDPTTWVRVHRDGRVESEDLGDVGQAHLYGDMLLAGFTTLRWKHFGDKDWRDVTGAETRQPQFVDGPLPRVVVDNAIYTVDHGKVKPLRPWPYGAASVDLAGRLWGIDETKDGEDAWLVMQPGTRAPIPPPDEWNGNE